MWETRAIVKLAAVGTSALLALCVSWIFPSPERVRSWYEALTYYLLFATFLIWLQAILPRRWQVPWRQLFDKHGLALGLAGVLTLCFVMISPPKFRIFNDEPVLAATALAMYQDHAVFSPLEGRHSLGSYEFPSQSVEKRPLFFPFFVSLAHTFSGYRPENVFAVNALAAGIGLFVFYLLLSQWLPAFWGRLGMLLLASFPLLATYSTSGGFDVPNLLFVLLAFWFFQRLVLDNDVRDLERLGLTLVILSQLRYESALLVLCVLVVLLFRLKPGIYAAMSYRAVILPLLFLPILWQRRLVSSPGDFGIAGGAPMFSLDRIPRHLAYAWDFFTGGEVWYGTVPPLFWLAIAGALYAAYEIWRRRRSLSVEARFVLAFLALCTIVHSGVMFTYYWGDLRVSVASRFGLMFLPLIVISSTFLLARLTEEFRLSRSYAVVLAVALIAFYWPFAMESRTSAHRTSFREFHTNLAYLEQHFPERKNLIIFDTPSWYVPYRWSAVTGRFANQNRQALMKALRRSEIPNMLVLQVIRYADGRPTQESVDLDRGFELETLFESQVSPTSYTRISRVKP